LEWNEKGHTTRAVFATDVRFDGLGASEETNEEATTQDNAGSRKRVATDGPQRPRNRVEPKEDRGKIREPAGLRQQNEGYNIRRKNQEDQRSQADYQRS
jgi:hypothetical protein